MINTNKEFSKELVRKLAEEYEEKNAKRFERLENYYIGKTDILSRYMEEGKPNNKTILNYPGYIVDMIQGYFLGQPVAYSTQTEEKELLEQVQGIFNLNDEQDENSELANIMGIKGIAYELLYADENANVRFEEMEPDNTFLVYDTKIIPEPFFGVRYFYIDEELFIEAYTKEYIYQWKLKNDTMIETLKEPHYFGGVPLIAYENNKRRMGDFEKVITLIDAIELATANSINDLEYFSDAYMYLINMMGTDSEDIKKMRSNRLILLDEEGEAGFLVKPSNGEDSNNIKDRLNVAIHKFSNIPDMSDENFASNASGVAMEYKHFGLDQVVANKERKFKTGLSRRLELICNFLNTKKATNKYSYDEIKMTFTRNKPTNEKENAEVANMLKGLVSDQTVMSHLFAVDDVNDELERIEAERGAYTPLMEIDDDEVDEVGDEGESLE